MSNRQLDHRLGLNVPYEWWPSAPLLKSFEAAGFAWVQVPPPPPSVLVDPHQCVRHAAGVADALRTTGLRSVVHGPLTLLVGTPRADRVFEGLLSYAADAGAEAVVYHARALPDDSASEDAQLAETRSLARLSETAERLGIVIALENLAPAYPGPELLSHSPRVLRTLAHRIASPALGLCLDVGHANIAADLRHADPLELIEPALDLTVLFHVHDNHGARRRGPMPASLDPLRLDLHLPPGRGTIDWDRIAPVLTRRDGVPLLLEVHPAHRDRPEQLCRAAHRALGGVPAERVAA